MSDGKSLPELPEARSLRGNDELLVNAGGQPRRASLATLFASRGVVYVNDFGAVADGGSHPLSETYRTIEAARADYPAAMALSDEKDWCAWQAATNRVYVDGDTSNPFNWSVGSFVASGNYVVNRTITFNHLGAQVTGSMAVNRFGSSRGGTTITYNGPNGTLDDPVYIFDFYLFDEARRGQSGKPDFVSGAPPGRKGNVTYSGGGTFRISNVTFRGKGGDINADASDVSGFVSGVRIRKGNYCRVEWCTFAGTLWDGVRFTDAQLFPTLEFNTFYGVHRDAVAFDRASDFSTTMRLVKNEFGLVGRYAILLDLTGSVEPGPVIIDNDFEHAYAQSFFVRHPEWFVQGLAAGVCIVNGGNLEWQANRFESGADLTAGYWADLHLVRSSQARITGGSFHNLAVTAFPGMRPRTQALVDYLGTHKHTDITDKRNFDTGTSRDHVDCEGISITGVYNMRKLLCADSAGLSTTGGHSLQEVGVTYLSIPLRDGPAGNRIVEPRPTAVPDLMPTPINLSLRSASLGTRNGVWRFGNYNTTTASGDYLVVSGSARYGPWEPKTKYVAVLTKGGLEPFRVPTTENGYVYQAIVGGTSGEAEPAWPAAIGRTVTDNEVTWKCAGTAAVTAEDRAIEWREAGARRRHGAAPPTIGTWSKGSIVWNSEPAPGTPVGWSCVAAGTPGTWKPFAAIQA